MKSTLIKKIFRVLKYAKPHLNLFIITSIILAISSVIAIANPYLMKILIDEVLLGGNLQLFYLIIVLFAGIFLFSSVISVVMAYTSTLLAERITYDVRIELFSHIENLGMKFYHKRKTGDILSRLISDVAGINSLIGIVLNNIILNILTGIAILIVCLTLNWKVTLASLLVFPFYVILQIHYGEKVKIQRKKIRKRSADILGFLYEKIVFMKLVQTFIREKYELNIYKKKATSLINMDIKMALLRSFAGIAIGFITFLPIFVIFTLGGYYVIIGVMSLGTLIALSTYIEMLFGPVSSLGSVNIAIQSAMVSVDRVFKFMDVAPEITEKRNAKWLKNVKGKIEFKDVHFEYGEGKRILDDVDFIINPGEKVLIKGASGVGKSTIADLLLRFYDPEYGTIRIDEIDLKDVKLASLRRTVGIISQESVLFNSSIKQNILFGKLNATQKEIEKAAKIANIHDFIMSLPKKYETNVDRGGANLSGGQKQRISIARTVLKDPKIIILDEATSNLDKESEKAVYDALEKATKDKTTLIITHHESGLKGINKKLTLKNGKIRVE
ncbi:ABC transporter ATP-binding protein [Candidatus Undinarchaeota archaeon]